LSLDRLISSFEEQARFEILRSSRPEDGSLGKFFLMLVLGFGAALYFPQTRPVVLDLLNPLLRPVFVWQTKAEMDKIVRELGTMDREGQRLPQPGQEFQMWMERSFQGGSLLDSWGSPYTLTLRIDSLALTSPGPDMVIGTPDDIVRTVEIQRRALR
jgi:hypothetical protein